MIPRLRFAHLPTPVESLPRLSHILGGPSLLVKRDDQTGLAFGGNKTRKLEFLLGEAQARGARMLITAGAVQSNHCRQTAAAAARFGFECTLVLTGSAPSHASANLLLDDLFGAQVIYIAERADRDRVLADTFRTAQEQGLWPFLVPYGGSSPTGVLGYVFAVEEYLRQEQADWIVFPSSSGGTQAGLVLGALHFGYKGKVLGISIDEPRQKLQKHVASLASEASDLLGSRRQVSPDEVLVNDEYCSAGYGVLTDAEREAVRLFARMEGLLLDPVYTGRAAAGMINLIRKGFFRPDETVLFWHTGGQPALFAEAYASINA